VDKAQNAQRRMPAARDDFLVLYIISIDVPYLNKKDRHKEKT